MFRIKKLHSRMLMIPMMCLWTYCASAISIMVPAGVDWVKQDPSIALGSTKISYSVMEVNIGGGDSLLLVAGQRKPIRFDRLVGDSLHPLVVCNQDHLVTISNPVDGYYGISFKNCRYIKLSGANNPGLVYGILVTAIPGGSAVSIGQFSSNFEVERIVVDDVGSSGIVAKTDPDCENYEVYKRFVMYDLRLHHNLIRKVANEGFYIGNTGYREGDGIPLSCKDPIVSKSILPHKIAGVKVYANICDSTGWDGIQVSASDGVEIHDNYITHDSYAKYPNQQSGILIGEPTTHAKVYNNVIRNGWGNAIQVFGVGTLIYNNVIIYRHVKSNTYSKPGADNPNQVYAIYVNDKACKDKRVPRQDYVVAHNTIIISVSNVTGNFFPVGIHTSAMGFVKSLVCNNLVVIDTLSMPGKKLYVHDGNDGGKHIAKYPGFITSNSLTSLHANMYCNSITHLGFTDPLKHDYSLTSRSPAIDQCNGTNMYQAEPVLRFDFLQVERPQGKAADVGAYEFVNVKF